MTQKKKSADSPRLVLTEESAIGNISVDMEAFFEFSFALAEDLEALVDRWSHLAAPRSNRSPNSQRRE
jgi:hypothetical protein